MNYIDHMSQQTRTHGASVSVGPLVDGAWDRAQCSWLGLFYNLLVLHSSGEHLCCSYLNFVTACLHANLSVAGSAERHWVVRWVQNWEAVVMMIGEVIACFGWYVDDRWRTEAMKPRWKTRLKSEMMRLLKVCTKGGNWVRGYTRSDG